MRLDELKIKIFADGADIESIQKLNKLNYIQGFTTNPSLMKKAGINNYKDLTKLINYFLSLNNISKNKIKLNYLNLKEYYFEKPNSNNKKIMLGKIY